MEQKCAHSSYFISLYGRQKLCLSKLAGIKDGPYSTIFKMSSSLLILIPLPDELHNFFAVMWIRIRIDPNPGPGGQK